MKLKVHFLGLFLLLSFFLTSYASAALLTSNTITDPDVIDFSQFVGNEYNGVSGPVQIGDLIGIDVTATGSNDGLWLRNSDWGLLGNGNWNSGRNGYSGYAYGGEMVFSFNDGPVTAVGGFMNEATGQNTDFIITAYDAAMNVIESYDIWAMAPINTPNGINDGAFRGIDVGSPLIYHFGVAGYVPVLDDLTFGGAGSPPPEPNNPIPEPATMILFGIGLLSLSGISRRKE